MSRASFAVIGNSQTTPFRLQIAVRSLLFSFISDSAFPMLLESNLQCLTLWSRRAHSVWTRSLKHMDLSTSYQAGSWHQLAHGIHLPASWCVRGKFYIVYFGLHLVSAIPHVWLLSERGRRLHSPTVKARREKEAVAHPNQPLYLFETVLVRILSIVM